MSGCKVYVNSMASPVANPTYDQEVSILIDGVRHIATPIVGPNHQCMVDANKTMTLERSPTPSNSIAKPLAICAIALLLIGVFGLLIRRFKHARTVKAESNKQAPKYKIHIRRGYATPEMTDQRINGRALITNEPHQKSPERNQSSVERKPNSNDERLMMLAHAGLRGRHRPGHYEDLEEFLWNLDDDASQYQVKELGMPPQTKETPEEPSLAGSDDSLTFEYPVDSLKLARRALPTQTGTEDSLTLARTEDSQVYMSPADSLTQTGTEDSLTLAGTEESHTLVGQEGSQTQADTDGSKWLLMQPWV